MNAVLKHSHVGIVFVVMFLSFAGCVEKHNKSKDLGAIDLVRSKPFASGQQYWVTRLLIEPTEEFSNHLDKEICSRLSIADEDNISVPYWIPYCAPKKMFVWVKLNKVEKKLRLFLCDKDMGARNERSGRDVFEVFINGKTHDLKEWVLESSLVKLSAHDDSIRIDTRIYDGQAGWAALFFPPLDSGIDNNIDGEPDCELEVEYRFKNLTKLENHQQRLLVCGGGGTQEKWWHYTNLLHPSAKRSQGMSYPGHFVIWRDFPFGGTLTQDLLPLWPVVEQKYYRVIMRLNFCEKKVSYIIYDDDYNLLNSIHDVGFFFGGSTVIPLDLQSAVTHIRIGDHCSDAGLAEYNYIVIRKSDNVDYGLSYNSKYIKAFKGVLEEHASLNPGLASKYKEVVLEQKLRTRHIYVAKKLGLLREDMEELNAVLSMRLEQKLRIKYNVFLEKFELLCKDMEELSAVLAKRFELLYEGMKELKREAKEKDSP